MLEKETFLVAPADYPFSRNCISFCQLVMLSAASKVRPLPPGLPFSSIVIAPDGLVELTNFHGLD